MFEELCSIYSSSKDNIGEYYEDVVDINTGEICRCNIREMSLKDFLLSDRWKETVLALRNMIATQGIDIKRSDEFVRLKTSLPGATLSGRFEAREDFTAFGKRIICSRRLSHLIEHTGYIALDIDLADNANLSSFDNIRLVLKHRPEVAMYMRSCSGTGFFAIVKLAYPEKHKQQFRALQKDYATQGIVLDKACSDVTRVRFASWDFPENEGGCLYVNESCIPYASICGESEVGGTLELKTKHFSNYTRDNDVARAIEKKVSAIEQRRIDITEKYDDWIRIGYALASVQHMIDAESYFIRISSLNSSFDETKCRRQFAYLQCPRDITIGTFFSICKKYRV